MIVALLTHVSVSQERRGYIGTGGGGGGHDCVSRSQQTLIRPSLRKWGALAMVLIPSRRHWSERGVCVAWCGREMGEREREGERKSPRKQCRDGDGSVSL